MIFLYLEFKNKELSSCFMEKKTAPFQMQCLVFFESSLLKYAFIKYYLNYTIFYLWGIIPLPVERGFLYPNPESITSSDQQCLVAREVLDCVLETEG